MTLSTHCGCGVFGGCGGSCSVSGRALLCACPPSTLQGKRNTSTHTPSGHYHHCKQYLPEKENVHKVWHERVNTEIQ